jgi:hypothetical protein
MKYSITVSSAELEVIMRAIGRMPTARQIPDKPVPRSVHGKPPRLSDRARELTSRRWADAVAQAVDSPGRSPFVGWSHLQTIADATGRRGDTDSVLKAWGIK